MILEIVKISTLEIYMDSSPQKPVAALKINVKLRQFPIYNNDGNRCDPVELPDGKFIDFNTVPGPAKRKIKKSMPGFMDSIFKQRKELTKPLEIHIYDCPQCKKRSNAFVLDEGKTPEKCPCAHCKFPMAEKRFHASLSEKVELKMKADVFFRWPTEKEFEGFEEAAKKYISVGGLFMELAK